MFCLRSISSALPAPFGSTGLMYECMCYNIIDLLYEKSHLTRQEQILLERYLLLQNFNASVARPESIS